MDTTDALKLIDKIDHVMAGKIHAEAVPPMVFKTLDDVNASRQDIERMGALISKDVYLRLMAVANSVYFGTLRRGGIGNFYDMVSYLGMNRAKALIIVLTNYHHGRQDEEIEKIFAKSYATSVMAEMLASQTGFREEAIRKAELCGLFLEVGRKVMVLYKKQYASLYERLDNDFIDTYHPYLGERIVGRYGLPAYIKTVILARNLILEESYISLAGIVHMAQNMVDASFQRYNRLVLKCQIPRPATDVTRTLEAIVKDKFRAVGLEKYLHIIRIPRIFDL